MPSWKIDPDHSVAAFAVRHMLIADVHGQFNRLSGTIRVDPPDLAHLSVEVEIDTTGIYTGIAKRDEHLRSPDFLHVERYPVITFKGLTVESLGGNRGKLTGDFTLRGVTRPVTMEFEYSGPVKDPFDESGLSLGFSARTKINRFDYDVSWNEGGIVVGKEVLITLEIEADKVVD